MTGQAITQRAGIWVDGTAAEFMAVYAKESRVTIADLKRLGRVPFYCSGCGSYDFPHWEMGRTIDDAFDRRNEIAPPSPLP